MRFLRGGLGSPVAWAATAVFLAVMVLWTVVTPAFRSPDEPQHVNSVLRLADGDGWPRPGTATVRPEVLRAKTLTGFSAVDGQMGNWIGGTLLPGVRPTIPEKDLLEPAKAYATNRFNLLNATMELDVAMAKLAKATGWDAIAPDGT